MIEQIKIAFEEFCKLDKDYQNILLRELFEQDKISFHEFSVFYIQDLKKRESVLNGKVSTLSLYSGVLAMGNSDPIAKDVRKYLYENKFHEGSKAGDELKKEFESITVNKE